MKKIILFVFCFSVFNFLNALGTLRVESIKMLPETSMNIEVRDADGKYAPVLIVKTELQGLGFQNISRPTKYAAEYIAGDHQYKFYMNDSQRVIRITHSEYEPFEVRLLADFGINVKAQRVYELVLTNVPEKIYIPINIVTDPIGTRIYIDGKDKGINETQKVFIGKHTIRIHKKGYKTITDEIEVTENKTLFKYSLTEIEDVPIMIYSVPEGAIIYIDNIRIGETPLASFYPDGKYKIKIEKGLYETIDEQIIIKLPKIEKRYILESLYATLNIETYPNATVYLNETKLDSLHNLHLEPMLINLKVTMPKAKPLEKRIILKKNEIRTLDLFPNVKTGTIQVGIIPEDAEIELSGDSGEFYTANEISNFKDIPVGEYELKVSKDGFKTYNETIVLKEKKKITKQIELAVGTLIPNMIFVEGRISEYRNDSIQNILSKGENIEYKKLVKAGFTPKEIMDYYKPQIDIALNEGYSLNDTYSYLGIYSDAKWSEIENREIYINSSPIEKAFIKNDWFKIQIESDDRYKPAQRQEIWFDIFGSSEERELIDPANLLKLPENLDYYSKEDFLALVREKYPVYEEKDDAILFDAILKKYPVYTNWIKRRIDNNLKNFYLGAYEVTFSEYDEYCVDTGREKPTDNGWGRGDNPVINISWFDAVEYCNWRSRKEELEPCYSIKMPWQTPKDSLRVKCNFNANGYRLPTVEEWGFAAMGGIKSNNFKYSGSNVINEVAWYEGNSEGKTHSVGQKKVNELGIYDMSGNVLEWCNDWEGVDSRSRPVLRGGSWGSKNYNCRAIRFSDCPDESGSDYGFRICRRAVDNEDEIILKKSKLNILSPYFIYIIIILLIIIIFIIVLLILKKRRKKIKLEG